jgi:NADPH:quinone reductase-like Zn-dependent oxidoreductase
VRVLEVTKGETLLVYGAAGGVGSMAVQIAVARGAIVIAADSPHHAGYLRSIGAAPVLATTPRPATG